MTKGIKLFGTKTAKAPQDFVKQITNELIKKAISDCADKPISKNFRDNVIETAVNHINALADALEVTDLNYHFEDIIENNQVSGINIVPEDFRTAMLLACQVLVDENATSYEDERLIAHWENSELFYQIHEPARKIINFEIKIDDDFHDG